MLALVLKIVAHPRLVHLKAFVPHLRQKINSTAGILIEEIRYFKTFKRQF